MSLPGAGLLCLLSLAVAALPGLQDRLEVAQCRAVHCARAGAGACWASCEARADCAAGDTCSWRTDRNRVQPRRLQREQIRWQFSRATFLSSCRNLTWARLTPHPNSFRSSSAGPGAGNGARRGAGSVFLVAGQGPAGWLELGQTTSTSLQLTGAGEVELVRVYAVGEAGLRAVTTVRTPPDCRPAWQPRITALTQQGELVRAELEWPTRVPAPASYLVHWHAPARPAVRATLQTTGPTAVLSLPAGRVYSVTVEDGKTRARSRPLLVDTGTGLVLKKPSWLAQHRPPHWLAGLLAGLAISVLLLALAVRLVWARRVKRSGNNNADQLNNNYCDPRKKEEAGEREFSLSVVNNIHLFQSPVV